MRAHRRYAWFGAALRSFSVFRWRERSTWMRIVDPMMRTNAHGCVDMCARGRYVRSLSADSRTGGGHG